LGLIELSGITKVYRTGDVEVHALAGVSLSVDEGEFISIMGPSGSGKSTLMHILGCLDQPTAGLFLLDDVEVSRLDDNQLAELRNEKLGFVFQAYNLLPRTSALANVELPMLYTGDKSRRRERAVQALERVGLGHRARHVPSELSGGEQQRVAIARALATQPDIILADEPTGNLDSRSGAEITAVLQRLNHEMGITIVFVTHDPDIAAHTRRIVRLLDGRIVADEPVESPRDAVATLAAALEGD